MGSRLDARLLDAPTDKLFRCWDHAATADAVVCAQPYATSVAEVDLRPAGRGNIVMKSPDGQEIPCPGTYLEIVPNCRLVFTDAFIGDWIPGEGAALPVAPILKPAGRLRNLCMNLCASAPLR